MGKFEAEKKQKRLSGRVDRREEFIRRGDERSYLPVQIV